MFVLSRERSTLAKGLVPRQKGYLLHRIPARLHVDWNQSALLDKVVDDSLDTAVRTNVPTLADRPSIPTNTASNVAQSSASTAVRSLDPTPALDPDLAARLEDVYDRLMPPPQVQLAVRPPPRHDASRSASRPIGGRNRSLSIDSNNSTTSKASARQRDWN